MQGPNPVANYRNKEEGLAATVIVDTNREAQWEQHTAGDSGDRRPHAESHDASRPSPKHTRAALRIGSLNIRGFRATGVPRSDNKWNHVNQVMRDKKIGILSVQEAHLSDDRKEEVEKLFGKRLKVVHSPDPENPTGKGGIAVVLNRNLLNVHDAESKTIVPGRAILVSVRWHKEEVINLLAVYAPNVTEHDGEENGNFWRTLNNFFLNNPRYKVDVMAGDLNMVENAQDRSPAREDPTEATEALDCLKQTLFMRDAWRDAFPTKRAFSYVQDATSSMSRIDRIYMTDPLSISTRDWSITPTGIPGTDHMLTTVQVAHADAPIIGKGRWVMKSHVIRDDRFRKFVVETGAAALNEIKALGSRRRPETNTQTIYRTWKNKVLSYAKERDKALVPKYIMEKKVLVSELNQKLGNQGIDEVEKRKEIKDTMRRMESLERTYHMAKRERIAIKNRLEGETMCKYWTTSNKQVQPRDLIYALRKDSPNQYEPPYESNSVKMAEMARNYHDKLQNKRRNISDQLREEKTRKVLSTIRTRTSERQKENLGSIIETKELLTALKLSNNSSAPGPDGIPYEFWKSFNNKFINDAKQNMRGGSQKVICNIIELLELLYGDIQIYGTIENSTFAEGWMCPLYKKNDRSEIANYRPITCLNTDYKILTKALSSRLSFVIRDLIHPSQAGFIPGRSIAEQTKLIRMMMQYAEAKEQNGLIVALDQEKAYDRIEHDYLWRALETFGIPRSFINTVKSLYKNAETRIMINGVMSSPWQITRGVRQGDPLSCLLFDLAIEPLAASLRQSNLKGYNIPGHAEKLIANLFADDTTTFLSMEDDVEDLNPILEDWCMASGANFNTEKTEIIPIGTLEYRKQVLENRRSRPDGPIISSNIRIAEEGTLVRILGAWYGNAADLNAPWTNVLEKIDKCLANWEKSHPTMEGRRHIAQMVIAGMSQYLAQVQGMSPQTEKLLAKRAVKFMWAGKSSLVNETTMYEPFDKGGRALVDIRTRNKAINIMWLKSYLKFGNDRPLWALVADALMADNTPKSEENVDDRIKVSPFLQSWKTKVSSRGDTSPDITSLFRIATEFNVRPEGLAFSRDILRQMPIWYHIAADPKIRRMNQGKMAECLRSKHKVLLVGDAEKLGEKITCATHRDSDECECEDCIELEISVGCMHPSSCVTRARDMLGTLPAKWDPRATQPDDRLEATHDEIPEAVQNLGVVFDARLATEGPLADIFRIFTTGPTYSSVYIPEVHNNENELRTAFIKSKNKFDETLGTIQVGAGVAFSEREDLNCEGKWYDNRLEQRGGVLLATILASMKSGTKAPLILNIRSQQDMAELTEDLHEKEDRGFLGVRNAGLLRTALGRLRMHRSPIIFQDIKEHPYTATERTAENLAELAMNNERLLVLPPIPTELHLTGAKLSKVTQSIAYKTIKQITPTQPRPRTVRVIEDVKETVKLMNKRSPSEKMIWSSLRDADLSKIMKVFLWKCLHDAYKVGSYWNRETMQAELKSRRTCRHDGKEDSLNHIISECSCAGQGLVWEEAENVWRRKTGEIWPKRNLPIVLGSTLAKFKGSNGRVSIGLTRLHKILNVEAAYFIWTLRCDRVINKDDTPFSNVEIKNRWNKVLRDRAELDVKMTDRKLGKKAIPIPVVIETWDDTEIISLERLKELDEDSQGGVLVGSWPERRSGVG